MDANITGKYQIDGSFSYGIHACYPNFIDVIDVYHLIYVYIYKYENGCIHIIRSLLNLEDPTISCDENAIQMY